MKRRDAQKTTHRSGRLLLGTAACALAFGAAFLVSPDWGQLAENAAIASAMVNMPEGSITLLRARFAGEIDETTSPPAPPPSIAPEQNASSAASQPPEPDMSDPSPEADPLTDTRPLQTPSPAREQAEIPEKYRGTLLQENMAGSPQGLVRVGAGLLRNYTELDNSEIDAIVAAPSPIVLEETDQPQVLIFHTHATEAYEAFDSENYDTRNSWRDTDNNNNMVVVGNALEKALRDAGIGVIHDTTQHDYPSYTGAYERSAETIQGYLEKYPTIKVALDVHRDAILRADDVTVKPVVEIDGKKAAQLMIITGSDDGTMNVPNWRSNLRFAAAVQDQIEQDSPQLTRPIFFCYRKYNMDLTPGSLLLEVGSNANTLAESVYTAELIGQSIAKVLNSSK